MGLWELVVKHLKGNTSSRLRISNNGIRLNNVIGLKMWHGIYLLLFSAASWTFDEEYNHRNRKKERFWFKIFVITFSVAAIITKSGTSRSLIFKFSQKRSAFEILLRWHAKSTIQHMTLYKQGRKYAVLKLQPTSLIFHVVPTGGYFSVRSLGFERCFSIIWKIVQYNYSFQPL